MGDLARELENGKKTCFPGPQEEELWPGNSGNNADSEYNKPGRLSSGPLKSEIFLTRTRMTMSSTLGTLETLEVVGMEVLFHGQIVFEQSSLRT